MKIEVRKPDVRDVVKLVASAADKRGNIPVLSNLLLEANDNVLRLTATNLEIGISALVNCQVIEEGKATANATKLAKLLSTITGEDVEISLEGDTLYVRSSNAKFSLATLPADEFPEIDLPEAYNVKLPSEEVDKAVRKVAYAVSRDEARYILTGVYFRSFGDKFHAVATDGHRLALYEVEVYSEAFDAIIPRKSLGELKKLLKESEEVELTESDSKLFFRIGDTVMWSSLIEGEYPDYMSVIPESNPLRAVADKEELLSALKEVSSIYDKEEVRAVLFNFSAGTLKLTAKKLGDEGVHEEAEVVIPVEYSGDEFTIGFNVNHMIESIASFDGSSIVISMDQPVTPVLISSEEEPQLKNVVMPMKV